MRLNQYNSIHITEAISELDLDNALDFISSRDLEEDFIKWTKRNFWIQKRVSVRNEE